MSEGREASAGSGRELILTRIRTALADVPSEEAPRWEPEGDEDAAAVYARGRRPALPARVEMFIERCGEYRASVVRCAADDAAIAAAIAAACARHAASSLVVPADLDPALSLSGLAVRRDDPPLRTEELDRADGVLTGCALAIADTGTIVLDGGPGQGRRALTLIPDLHICLVRGEQIVAGVPEAFERLDGAVRDGRPITFISGPSATSDIELRRVEGVHGPRRLEVIVAATFEG